MIIGRFILYISSAGAKWLTRQRVIESFGGCSFVLPLIRYEKAKLIGNGFDKFFSAKDE